MEITHTK